MKVLSLNLGSSSLKYAVHIVDGGNAECILSRDVHTSSQPDAAQEAARTAIADTRTSVGDMDAVGHRVVFGGEDDAHAIVDDQLLQRLESLQSLDPLHIPGAVAVIRQAQSLLVDVVHVACFDTAFFHDLPREGRALPIPSVDPLLRRYGFHGLSYESVVRALGPEIRPRTILAHLGNGASVASLLDGRPVYASMGFSPLGGLIMSTRPGDLDPGVLLYLLERSGVTVPELRGMLETRSGLRAFSGGEGDVQALCKRSDSDAEFAVDMFVRSVARTIAALAAEIGGMDLLAFSGGIGEHNERIRRDICARIRFFSQSASVHVVKSDENKMLAMHAARIAERAAML